MLLAICASIRFWPVEFQPDSLEEGWFLIIIVTALSLTACLYLVVVLQLRQIPLDRRWLAYVFVVAAATRLLILGSDIKVEDDYFRYLWDGAVTANGLNPYAHSPQSLLSQPEDLTDNDREEYVRLSHEAPEILSSINHSHLRTIYPPLAQGFFATAHWLAPFKIIGLRLAYLILECILAVFLIRSLRSNNKSVLWMVAYLWNPLILFEIHYRCHYDLLVALVIFAFIYFLVMKRFKLSATMLSLAVGGKLWPILLAPFLLSACKRSRKILLSVLFILIAMVSVQMIPYKVTLNRYDDSGALQYSKEWEANTLAYLPLKKLYRGIKDHFGYYWDERIPARGTVVLIPLLLSVLLARRQYLEMNAICQNMCWVVLVMLLLSPTVYAWYYVVMIPLFLYAPSPVFLVWTVLFPITYLKKWLIPELAVSLMLHLPVWGIMTYQAWKFLTARKGIQTLAE